MSQVTDNWFIPFLTQGVDMAGIGSHVGVGIVAAASATTGVACAANTAAVGGQGDTALGASKNAVRMDSDAYLLQR